MFEGRAVESPKEIYDWKNGLTGTARRRRKSSNDRKIIETIIYIMRTGLPWRDLPVWFGNWKTVYSQFRRYSKTTLWSGILNTLRALFSDPEWVMVDATSVFINTVVELSEVSITSQWDNQKVD